MQFSEYRRASIVVLENHERWMRAALEQASLAHEHQDVPIGAVVVDAAGQIIGTGYNRREADQDPTAHAEIIAIKEAAAHLQSWRLEECTLVVTLEPCVMCAGAIMLARIPKVVLGAWEEKTGAVGSQYDVLRDRRLPYSAEVFSGVLEAECAQLLKDFFKNHR